jgi:hypothetical protein
MDRVQFLLHGPLARPPFFFADFESGADLHHRDLARPGGDATANCLRKAG